MVKLFPVRTVKSTSHNHVPPPGSPVSKIPNRFRSKYDRSVFGGDDCVKAFQSCSCYQCSKSPLIVISAGEKVCDQYNITLRTVKEFMDGGLLEAVQDETFLIYAQKNYDTNSYQIGILAALDIDDCKAKIIKKHENCIPDTIESSKVSVAQRQLLQKQKHYQSLYVDPVMIMYRQSNEVDGIIRKIIDGEQFIPLQIHESGRDDSDDVTDHDHMIWFVKDPEDVKALQRAFEAVDYLYIADGHHRTSAACKAQSSKKNLPPSSKYLNALIFPDSQLNVLSFHRCIKSFPGEMNRAQFFDKVEQQFYVTEISIQSNQHAKCHQNIEDEQGTKELENDIKMYLDNRWYKLNLRSKSRASTVDSNTSDGSATTQETSSSDVPNPLKDVDAQILVENLIAPVLGVSYPQSEQHMIYIDGRLGYEGVERCVNRGDAVVGFTVGRMSTDSIMRVADADQLLPPKATFFDPKPMAGLLLRLQR